MVELELVGLSEDGRQLVLADAAGNEFVVPLDGRLRALARNGRVPTGQLENSMESAQAQSAQSALRPRDIQARIRAGETPEAVAEIAQVPVDKIMGYAVPVMAERQHIAERAQRSAVRRRTAEGPTTQLWDAVADQLRSQQVDPMSCQWDAWRRQDGRWTVTARYRGRQGERTGTFVFDALSRYAVADDDDARWLVGEQPERKPSQQASGSRGKGSGRRLSAVASEYDAMLFDDEEPTTDLTAVADALGDHDDEADRADGADQADHAAHTARGDAGSRDDAEEPRTRGPARREHTPAPDTEQQAGRAAAGDEPPPKPVRTAARQRGQQPKPEKRGRRGRGRASVPSWDEIMFGQPKG
jgi:Protein of unknown function (DUF3071)